MEDFHITTSTDAPEESSNLEFEIRPIYEESAALSNVEGNIEDDLGEHSEYILSSMPTSPINMFFSSLSRPTSPTDEYNVQFTTYPSCIPGSSTEVEIPSYLLTSISDYVSTDIMENTTLVSNSDSQSTIPSSSCSDSIPEEKVEVELKPEVKKEAQADIVRDGKDGWTDLKKNSFLRREFFKFYNASKSECSTCPKPNKGMGVVRPIYNLSNYYHSSEQTVCMEGYYYGSVKGRNVTTVDISPKDLKCPECKKGIPKNDLLRHIVTHINGAKKYCQALQDQVCKYCLHPVKSTSRVIDHIVKKHRNFCSNGHCCRICNTTFEDSLKTTLHMWKSHCESELPYKCPICAFQTSFLYSVIDHFDQEHLDFKYILCPLCLKSFRFSIPLLEYDDIVQHIIGHKLQGANNVASCGSCALKFVEDYDYVQHLSDKSLHSTMKTDQGFVAYVPTRDGKNKVLLMAKDPNLIDTIIPCTHSQNPGKKPRTDQCSFTDAHEKVFSKVLETITPSASSMVDGPKKFQFPSPRVISK